MLGMYYTSDAHWLVDRHCFVRFDYDRYRADLALNKSRFFLVVTAVSSHWLFVDPQFEFVGGTGFKPPVCQVHVNARVAIKYPAPFEGTPSSPSYYLPSSHLF
jgi:hypothetical protein